MIPDTHISEHFTWADVTNSTTASRLGIDNSLPPDLREAALRGSVGLEKIRVLLDHPIFIHSWYRGPALQALPEFYNPKSQHPTAGAMDWVCPGFGTPVECCKKIIKYSDLIRFDQLILEHTWVHVSFPVDPNVKPRGQVLSLLKSKEYASGLTDLEGKPL